MKEISKLGNAKVYGETKALLLDYSRSEIHFTDIDLSLLKKLEQYCVKRGLGGNTIERHFRTLRALYNRAVADGIIIQSMYPFKSLLNPKGFNVAGLAVVPDKKALSADELKKFMDYTPGNEREELAKDVFMFSFYCQGISFAD